VGPVASIDGDQRNITAQLQCSTNLVNVMPQGCVKTVQRGNERDVVTLEVVEGSERVADPSAVNENDGAQSST
jgi:hypothetical protein